MKLKGPIEIMTGIFGHSIARDMCYRKERSHKGVDTRGALRASAPPVFDTLIQRYVFYVKMTDSVHFSENQ